MKIRIGIPNRGRISSLCCDLINDNLGVFIQAEDRVMLYSFKNKEEEIIEIVMLRSTDIPLMLEEKNIDMGITGNDYFLESRANITESNNLFMFNGLLCILARKDSAINSINDLKRKKEVVCCSQYPNLSRDIMKRINCNFSDIRRIDGAAESYLKLDLCEIIIDVVTSGTTFIKNNLKIVNPILSVSTHIYFNNEYAKRNKELCCKIGHKLCGREMSFYEWNESISNKNYERFFNGEIMESKHI